MNKIKYEVQCDLCGKTHVLDVYAKDLDEYYDTPRNERRHVQDIFHYLTPDERELIMSHTCSKCWERMISFCDEEEVDENDN